MAALVALMRIGWVVVVVALLMYPTMRLIYRSPKAMHFFDMDYLIKEDKHDGTLL